MKINFNGRSFYIRNNTMTVLIPIQRKTAIISFLFLVFQVVFIKSFVPPSSSLSPFKFGIKTIQNTASTIKSTGHNTIDSIKNNINKIDNGEKIIDNYDYHLTGLQMISDSSNEIESPISASLSDDESINEREESQITAKTPTKTKDKKIAKQLEEMKVNAKVSLGYDLEIDEVPLHQDSLMPVIETIVKAADSRKGIDIFAVRISSISSIASFAVMVTGNSKTQLNAIAEIIDQQVEENHNIRVDVPEGNASGGWILLDYGSIIVHIMTPVGREYYKLENMWKKGEKIDLDHILKPNIPDTYNTNNLEGAINEEKVDPFWS